MEATIRINLNTPGAMEYLQYTRTLPFAEVKSPRKGTKSAWQKALDEGAVPLNVFTSELHRQIDEHFDKLYSKEDLPYA